jgi:hypothetical protein
MERIRGRLDVEGPQNEEACGVSFSLLSNPSPSRTQRPAGSNAKYYITIQQNYFAASGEYNMGGTGGRCPIEGLQTRILE